MNIVQKPTIFELSEQDCLLVQGGGAALPANWSSLEKLPCGLSDKVEKPDLDLVISANTQP
ncbi:MAG: hypothetical protein SWN10_16915 [Pseudomonadota bacterium]|nr:hypothetical protein [Alteromonadaceae bacterium]MDY6928769.1 hypothetical protein [Pseudomonadota bacterium]